MRALDLSAVPAPMPGVIDLMDYYPGPIAASHNLRARDGRTYAYFGDLRGFWSRTIDPGCVDYHLWTPTAMYYFGYQDAKGLHWAIPPTLALPRFWNPYEPYRQDSTEFYVHRALGLGLLTWKKPIDVRLEGVFTTITVETVRERGETLYRLEGVTNNTTETWWLSPALPIQGGGTAPGMRGFEARTGDHITQAVEFTEWVPK